jgi:hypothetical protein
MGPAVARGAGLVKRNSFGNELEVAMRRTLFVLSAVFVFASANVSAATIDHNAIAGVASLPQSTMDAIGQQKWFFTHASVGGNMLGGLDALHASDSTRYQLATTSVASGSNAPASTVPGTVYGCDRDNPGWSAKYTIFDNSVRNAGWHSPAVGIVMDKLCYIDQDANATTYVNTMSALETSFPSTVFVYTTMPLTTGTDNDNILRNSYNQAVRNYCGANKKLLFDIADIESHDPNGVASTFTSDGVTYQKLYGDYSSDGGHLNDDGAQRVALGWYATAAAITVPEPGSLAMLVSGLLGLGVCVVARRRSKA